jgi:hypothetical protein
MGLLAAALVASSGTVLSHHSFAVFDTTKTMTVEGTVKVFQFTNPHVWLELIVKDENNQETLWLLEGSSLMALYRSGWKKSMIKSGDKVKVTLNPLKSGKPGGVMLTVELPNGVSMKTCCS